MHVITHARIITAMHKWPQAETALDGWYRTIKANDPKDFAEMKQSRVIVLKSRVIILKFRVIVLKSRVIVLKSRVIVLKGRVVILKP